MKTKPFDLEAAKNGAPLVTRDGRKARFIAYVPEAEARYVVTVFVEGATSPGFRHEDGILREDRSPSEHDLFIQVQTKTMYVNLYHERAGIFTAYSFQSEELALANAGRGASAIAQKIEVELP